MILSPRCYVLLASRPINFIMLFVFFARNMTVAKNGLPWNAVHKLECKVSSLHLVHPYTSIQAQCKTKRRISLADTSREPSACPSWRLLYVDVLKAISPYTHPHTMNQLEQLNQYSTVVADTGDFQLMKKFRPRDATTNPSLILKAVQKEEYRPLLEKAVRDSSGKSHEAIIDRLLILFGSEISKIVPGRVSTELDARLSFDTQATIRKGRELIALYEASGIPRERILIKIASTWEGIKAAEALEKEGIRCNLTLLFSLPQAIACAEAKVRLISPFVGRIYDWHRKTSGQEHIGADDPGVRSVERIFNYYRKFGYETEVMGASFRNTSQILALAGCDLLTISPELLQALADNDSPVQRRLYRNDATTAGIERIAVDERSFRLLLNEDAMATEKLAEGIRLFCADLVKLEKMIEAL